MDATSGPPPDRREPLDAAAAVAANRDRWDEMAALHAASRFYPAAEGIRSGRRDLGGAVAPSFEWDEIGPVAGQRVCHLQCHIGTDTVLFGRRGAAEVVGVDFAPAALTALEALATELGVAGVVRGVESDVAGAPAATGGGFDLVYTSWGALIWNPDIDAWAATIRDLLRPGGRLYLADSHPLTTALDRRADGGLAVAWPSSGGTATRTEEQGTYALPDAVLEHTASQEWSWSIGEVVTALLGAGLVLEHLAERAELVWELWPTLRHDPDGYWRDPDGLPLSFSLGARRPG